MGWDKTFCKGTLSIDSHFVTIWKALLGTTEMQIMFDILGGLGKMFHMIAKLLWFGHAIGYNDKTSLLQKFVTLPWQCNLFQITNAMMIDVKSNWNIVANWPGGSAVYITWAYACNFLFSPLLRAPICITWHLSMCLLLLPDQHLAIPKL